MTQQSSLIFSDLQIEPKALGGKLQSSRKSLRPVPGCNYGSGRLFLHQQEGEGGCSLRSSEHLRPIVASTSHKNDRLKDVVLQTASPSGPLILMATWPKVLTQCFFFFFFILSLKEHRFKFCARMLRILLKKQGSWLWKQRETLLFLSVSG